MIGGELQTSLTWQRLAVPAAAHYDPAMPYHNWNHAERVGVNAFELGRRCVARGLAVDCNILAVAGAWRDAGYHQDHRARSMPTKEHYSAELAGSFLTMHGVRSGRIKLAETMILGTIHGADRTDIGALILHRADVANIGSKYDEFAGNALRLLDEERQHRPDLSFKQWQVQTARFVDFSVTEAQAELPRLGEPVGVDGAFDVQAQYNHDRLLTETSERDMRERLSLLV